MTGKFPPPVGGRTLADELRDDLAYCEQQVIQVGKGTDAIALLRHLDSVADQLEQLERRGVDLRAERSRWETVLAQLRRRASALVEAAGDQMAAQRPPDARWWWHLDAQVVMARRRRLARVAAGTVAALVFLVLAYGFYDRLLAPPPAVRQINRLVQAGEDALVAGDLSGAIERFEGVTALDPQHTEAWLWLGVLYQESGHAGQADDAFERARALMPRELDFFFRRGLLYVALNDLEAARQDALTAIETSPDRPEGYFLLGDVAEQAGEFDLAAAAFRQASDLARAVGEIELEATARVRLANVLQLRLVEPEP